MIHCAPIKRGMIAGWGSGLLVVTVLALVSCGGSDARSSGSREPPARIPGAHPVALGGTLPALLAVCLHNRLLKPICPRVGPSAGAPHTSLEPLGWCIDRAGRDIVSNGHFGRLAGGRCVDAGWGYEAISWPPGFVIGETVTARGWDPATGILAAPEANLLSPPLHVHVEIEASLGSLIGEPTWPTGARAVSDTLLSPKRTAPVSLGWVTWSGRYGQLVINPVYPSGGEWGGHLIFRFTSGHVNYAVTLHAWMPAVRITGSGVERVIRFEAGPALPRVIATLKAIVDSATVS